MTIPQIFFTLLGAAVLVVAGWYFLCRRTRRFIAVIWMALGGAMLVVGLQPAIIEIVGPDSFELRCRLAVALFSVMIPAITLETVRRTNMLERYAILWVLTGVMLLVASIFPGVVRWIGTVTGMDYGSTVVFVTFGFLLLLSFHFSVAISRALEKQNRMAQYAGLLELRIRELERRLGEDLQKGCGAPSQSVQSGSGTTTNLSTSNPRSDG